MKYDLSEIQSDKPRFHLYDRLLLSHNRFKAYRLSFLSATFAPLQEEPLSHTAPTAPACYDNSVSAGQGQ